MRYLDDFAAGKRHELGTVVFTREQIVEFAGRWDPMPFHLSEEAGAAGPFGGLVASGGHIIAALTRQYVVALLVDADCRGSYGLDDVRFFRPIRPDDEMRVVATTEATSQTRRPEVGALHLLVEGLGEDGARVCRLRTRLLLRRTPRGRHRGLGRGCREVRACDGTTGGRLGGSGGERDGVGM